MRPNLYQIRRSLLLGTFFWLLLTLLAATEPLALIPVLLVGAIASVLYWLIPSEAKDDQTATYALTFIYFGAAATAALAAVQRIDLLPVWSAPLAVGVAWGVVVSRMQHAYKRLVTIPTNMLHVYNSLLGARTVRGYRKIPRPHPLEQLQAVVPTRKLKLDIEIPEIGTTSGFGPGQHDGQLARSTLEDEHRQSIWNIHRLELAIELAIDPERWRSLLRIPSDDLLHELRTHYGAKAWQSDQYWSGIAKGYVREIAIEQTRELIHASGWSALCVWQRQEELARALRKRLEACTAPYGITIHSVEVVNVAIDEPVALRRTRDLELMGETWQRQQAQILETFQATLKHMGIDLTPEEAEHLTRIHLWDLVSHLRHYGHLDYITNDLVAGAQGTLGNGRLNGRASLPRPLA